jgi:hypothetical protein
MVVRTQLRGRHIFGLLVEAEDLRRHFPEKCDSIELQLGGLRIDCSLPAEFWNGRPEISDPRLSEWLDFKIFHGRPARTPIELELTPAGPRAFTLALPVNGDSALGNRALQSADEHVNGSVKVDLPEPLEQETALLQPSAHGRTSARAVGRS